MVLQLPFGPRASHDCSSFPAASHSLIRLRLDVQTCPCASAKIPITWPQVQSAGFCGHAGSALNVGTPVSAAAPWNSVALVPFDRPGPIPSSMAATKKLAVNRVGMVRFFYHTVAAGAPHRMARRCPTPPSPAG
jgi:hypothetical protein